MATSGFSIEVIGLEDAIKHLKELPDRVVRNCFAQALTSGSVPMYQAVQAETPVLTGDLKAALKTKIQINADGKGGSAEIGFFGKLEAAKARWAEYGHRLISHKPDLKDSGKVSRAFAFMRRASEGASAAAVEAFEATLAARIKDGNV